MGACLLWYTRSNQEEGPAPSWPAGATFEFWARSWMTLVHIFGRRSIHHHSFCDDGRIVWRRRGTLRTRRQAMAAQNCCMERVAALLYFMREFPFEKCLRCAVLHESVDPSHDCLCWCSRHFIENVTMNHGMCVCVCAHNSQIGFNTMTNMTKTTATTRMERAMERLWEARCTF
jgi:hypothetical protein